MSSYNVRLINNKTSEFVVKFRGPQGSAYEEVSIALLKPNLTTLGSMGCARGAPRSVPLQVSVYRVYEPHLPSQHRPKVSSSLPVLGVFAWT